MASKRAGSKRTKRKDRSSSVLKKKKKTSKVPESSPEKETDRSTVDTGLVPADRRDAVELLLVLLLLVYVFTQMATSFIAPSPPMLQVLAVSVVLGAGVCIVIRKEDVVGHYLLTFILLFFIFTEIPGLNSLFATGFVTLLVFVWTEFIDPEEHISETSMCLVYAIVLAKAILFVLHATLATSTPIVAVVSNSMKHDNTNEEYAAWVKENGFPISNGFTGGDVLLVVGTKAEGIRVGDVIVYYHSRVPMPIVHRAVGVACTNKDESPCTKVRALATRGDHNAGPDRWAVTPDMLEGRAVLRIPKLGLIKAAPVCLLKSSCSVIACIMEGECKGRL